MSANSDDFKRCLENCDVPTVRRLWAHVSPHLPQPKTDDAALAAIHHARTLAASIRMNMRAYSHAWLLDRGLPSGLPDSLKPEAERMFPRSVGAVGIAVKSQYSGIATAIRGAMEYAVHEAYADGHQHEPAIVKARMMEARERERRGLGL